VKHFIHLLTIVAVFVCSKLGAAEPKMTKIVTRMISPAIDADSFAAKPKTMYFAGKQYARIEEVPDVQNEIHELMVINEPDSWMINLWDKSGRHLIDPGPTFEVHSPILLTATADGKPDLDPEFKGFEFGNEVHFFRQHKAHEIEKRQVGGKLCKQFSLEHGSRKIFLLVDPKTDKPWQIDIQKDGKLEYSIRYLSYETDLPFEKSLFRPPEDVKISEPSSSPSPKTISTNEKNIDDLLAVLDLRSLGAGRTL
jgi:hypothetical protein